MADLVLSGSVERRASLACEPDAQQVEGRQFHADIAAVGAVVRRLMLVRRGLWALP